MNHVAADVRRLILFILPSVPISEQTVLRTDEFSDSPRPRRFCTGLMPPSVISIFRFFEDVIDGYDAGRIRVESTYAIGRLKSSAWPQQRAHWAAVFEIWS